MLDEWAPQARRLDQEAALAELTWRYFNGHGPATLQDFVWWSGLKVRDARAGLELVSSRLQSLTVNDQVYWMNPETARLSKKAPIVNLLPGFDEYLLGYRGRSASLDPADTQKIQPGSNGVFASTIVIDGKVVGTWKRELMKKALRISTDLFRPLSKKEAQMLEETFCRYSRFLGVERGAELKSHAKTQRRKGAKGRQRRQNSRKRSQRNKNRGWTQIYADRNDPRIT